MSVQETEFEKNLVFQSYFPENSDFFLNLRKFSRTFSACLNFLGFSNIFECFFVFSDIFSFFWNVLEKTENKLQRKT